MEGTHMLNFFSLLSWVNYVVTRTLPTGLVGWCDECGALKILYAVSGKTLKSGVWASVVSEQELKVRFLYSLCCAYY